METMGGNTQDEAARWRGTGAPSRKVTEGYRQGASGTTVVKRVLRTVPKEKERQVHLTAGLGTRSGEGGKGWNERS